MCFDPLRTYQVLSIFLTISTTSPLSTPPNTSHPSTLTNTSLPSSSINMLTSPKLIMLLIYLTLLSFLFLSTAATPVASFSYSHQHVSKQPKQTSDPNLNITSSRIVNGQPVTTKHEYPFVVDLSFHQLAISSSRFCTATLIAPDIVLTAAHCVLNHRYTSPVYATVGRIQLEDNHLDNNKSQTFRTIASIVHPQYRGLGSPNDVALMLLNASSDAPAVRLAHRTPRKDDIAWVVGYGIQMLGTVEGSSRPIKLLSRRLQKTALRIKDKDFCSNKEMGLETAPGMLCTAGVKKRSSACRGDSGGGLFSRNKTHGTDDKDDVVQIGIVSYGDAQCSSEQSGVFTDVFSVKQWIELSMVRLHAISNAVRTSLECKATKEINCHGATNGTETTRLAHLESNIRIHDVFSNSAEEKSATSEISVM